MRNISKVLAISAVVVAVAIVAAVMRLGKGGNSFVGPQTNEDRTVQPQAVDHDSNSSARFIVRTTSPPIQRRVGAVTDRATNLNSVPPKPATPGVIADWDEKVNDILGPEGDEKEKAK